MSESIIQNLVETRKRVVLQVNQGLLAVDTAASILGISRQAVWKIRKRVSLYGLSSITGRKRGPKAYHRVWNRTPQWLEDRIDAIYTDCGGIGSDRITWFLDDSPVSVSRATIYRILIRRRLHIPLLYSKRRKPQLYTKGYPGEEVQVDTTEPLGKHGPTLISAIDDYSRYGMAECYYGNKAIQAASFLRSMVETAPFPITAVRVDNGSEFQGAFKTTCKELGIQLIRNPVRHPTSNGKVERFHRIIEEECFWRTKAQPDDLEYARYWLSRYLSWYNTKRRHGGYGMEGRTPVRRIEEWIMNQQTDGRLYWRDVNETLILYKH